MEKFSVKPLLALGLMVSLFSFFACQKDGINPTDTATPSNVAGDRSPEHFTYGITVFDGVNPCQIVEIDEATGNFTGTAFNVFVDPGTGPVVINDLKGISRTPWGQFFVTTGPNNPALYQNALLKVNVNVPGFPLGQASYFGSNSPDIIGAVSDLEFDPTTQDFVGLANNNNTLVRISAFSTNWTTYSAVPITGIAAGTSLKGLAWVNDGVGNRLVGCANRTGSNTIPTRMYNINPITAGATFLTALLPAANFNGGHCALGYDSNLNHMAINRRGPLGLSEIKPWNPPFGANTGTAVWGLNGFNFEDLTSYPN